MKHSVVGAHELANLGNSLLGAECCVACLSSLLSEMTLVRQRRQIVMQLGIAIAVSTVAHANVAACTAVLDLSSTHETASRPYGGSFNKEGEAYQMTAQTIEQRARQLRAALQQTYQRLVESQELRGGLHGTDITATVLPFIPVGIEFSEAETLLSKAGFTVDPHPDSKLASNPNRPKDWYAVVARLSPFIEAFPSKVDLYVSLIPKSPGNYSTISEIRAQIFVSVP